MTETGECTWYSSDPVYKAYHDTEWGVPEWDSRSLWEKLILDGFQAGLSWITILKKRESFRTAFDGFDPSKVAAYGEMEITRLLTNPGIVRHRGKIEATIGNAQAYQRIEEREGFGQFLWNYVDGAPIQNNYRLTEHVPTQSALSKRISNDLKSEGFRFCGPTIVYAFMEAVGMYNDHLVGCPRHAEVKNLARR